MEDDTRRIAKASVHLDQEFPDRASPRFLAPFGRANPVTLVNDSELCPETLRVILNSFEARFALERRDFVAVIRSTFLSDALCPPIPPRLPWQFDLHDVSL